ncbi:MAG: nucleoside-diphosphate kinase [Candidatus Helarchaeota archaeon]
MEKCLVFLKPDAVLRRGIGAAILQEFLNKKEFSILTFKEVEVSEELAREHYKEHEKMPFFPWLIKALCIAPVVVMIIQGEIQRVREFLGATFVEKAEANTIRAKYGIWGGVNSVHASDSQASGQREIKLWMTFTGLEEDPRALEKVSSYIQKWIRFKGKNTYKIRDLCKKISENPSIGSKIYHELVSLLLEDCPDSGIQEVQNLVDVIVENISL